MDAVTEADETRSAPRAPSRLSRLALAAAVGAALLTIPFAATLLSLSRGWDWDFSDVPSVVVELGPFAWLVATVAGLGLGIVQLLRPSQGKRLPAIAAALGALSLLVVVPLGFAAADSERPVVDPESVQSASPGHSVRVLGGSHGVLASDDGGATWTTHTPSHDSPPLFWAWRFAFSDSEGGWAVERMRGAVLKTTDGGATWSDSLPDTGGSLLDVAASDGGHVWAIGHHLLEKESERLFIVATRDGGATWKEQPVPGTGGLHAVDSVGARHAWAVGEDWERGESYIVATHHSGRQWRVQYRAKQGELSLSGIAFADTRNGWAVGTRSNSQRLRDDTGVILATNDGGSTWKKQYEASRPLRVVDCPDAQHAWVGGRDGLILATNDGGGTWAEQSSGAGEWLWPKAIAFSDADHGWILADHDALLATSDGGATWESLKLGRNVHFNDVAAVRAAGAE